MSSSATLLQKYMIISVGRPSICFVLTNSQNWHRAGRSCIQSVPKILLLTVHWGSAYSHPIPDELCRWAEHWQCRHDGWQQRTAFGVRPGASADNNRTHCRRSQPYGCSARHKRANGWFVIRATDGLPAAPRHILVVPCDPRNRTLRYTSRRHNRDTWVPNFFSAVYTLLY